MIMLLIQLPKSRASQGLLNPPRKRTEEQSIKNKVF